MEDEDYGDEEDQEEEELDEEGMPGEGDDDNDVVIIGKSSAVL